MNPFDGRVRSPVTGWMWISSATASSTNINTWANISGFNSVAKDLVGCSYSTGDITITAPSAEVSVWLKITWTAAAGTRRGARLLYNGSNVAEVVEGKDTASEQVSSQIFLPGLDVVAGDTISLQGWQNGSPTLTVIGGSLAQTSFHIRRVN